ncbi:UDP-N-acetylmuramate dehydrogenase [Marinobacter sp. 1Y8]
MSVTPLSPRKNAPLQSLNTLRFSAVASWLQIIDSLDTLRQALAWGQERSLPILVLGGGSNIVFGGDFPGLVLQIALRGRCWSQVDNETAILELGAGENWHDTVMYAVRSGYRGIENLALIPGTVGAAPIQNIGAYGVELRDALEGVKAWDCDTGETVVLSRDDCQFGYRDSVFKQQPDRYVVLGIRLKLSKTAPFNLDYRDLQAFFVDRAERSELTVEDVANAVIKVRNRKLPNPDMLPNAGSFFKNPVVSRRQYDELLGRFPGIVAYVSDDVAKLAAGWLIDQCGWKGFREGHVGVHSKQALVLVHHGHGEGLELLSLASRIRDDVKARFGVVLEVEPRIFPLSMRNRYRL